MIKQKKVKRKGFPKRKRQKVVFAVVRERNLILDFKTAPDQGIS